MRKLINKSVWGIAIVGTLMVAMLAGQAEQPSEGYVSALHPEQTAQNILTKKDIENRDIANRQQVIAEHRVAMDNYWQDRWTREAEENERRRAEEAAAAEAASQSYYYTGGGGGSGGSCDQLSGDLAWIAYEESKCDPYAHNTQGSGATGILQFMPGTFAGVCGTCCDIYSVECQRLAGEEMLRQGRQCEWAVYGC